MVHCRHLSIFVVAGVVKKVEKYRFLMAKWFAIWFVHHRQPAMFWKIIRFFRFVCLFHPIFIRMWKRSSEDIERPTDRTKTILSWRRKINDDDEMKMKMKIENKRKWTNESEKKNVKQTNIVPSYRWWWSSTLSIVCNQWKKRT